jgi:hypothetical protein
LDDHRTFTGGGSFNHGRFQEEEAQTHRKDGSLDRVRLFRSLFLLEVDRTRRNHR